LAAIQGGAVNRKPVIGWPKNKQDVDIAVYPAGLLAERPYQNGPLALAFVPNLYRQFQMMGEDIMAMLRAKPAEAADLIEIAQTTNLELCKNAITNGAIGVFYEVHGATASQCTPMQYGGLFLEGDRAFLDELSHSECNVVYINGTEPYLDFVSDLPAQVFAWDREGSNIPVSEVRKLRPGALAASDPEADFLLSTDGPITENLERLLAVSNV
jgi:hypothetical protein